MSSLHFHNHRCSQLKIKIINHFRRKTKAFKKLEISKHLDKYMDLKTNNNYSQIESRTQPYNHPD